jgi:hypothetical protein
VDVTMLSNPIFSICRRTPAHVQGCPAMCGARPAATGLPPLPRRVRGWLRRQADRGNRSCASRCRQLQRAASGWQPHRP